MDDYHTQENSSLRGELFYLLSFGILLLAHGTYLPFYRWLSDPQKCLSTSVLLSDAVHTLPQVHKVISLVTSTKSSDNTQM